MGCSTTQIQKILNPYTAIRWEVSVFMFKTLNLYLNSHVYYNSMRTLQRIFKKTGKNERQVQSSLNDVQNAIAVSLKINIIMIIE